MVHITRTSRRAILAVATAGIAAVGGLTAPIASGASRQPAQGSAVRTPIMPGGPLPTAGSIAVGDAGTDPSISADGRFVVFTAAPGDGRTSSVYVRDREQSSPVELTSPAAGGPAGDSVLPAISSDGCVVATVTQMPYDVFRDDNRGSRWDVYRTVLPHCGGTAGEWELVSSAGTSARGDADPTDRPAVSASGAVIAYTHVASDMPQPPTPERPITAIDVVDLTVPLGSEQRTQPAAGMPVEAPRTTFRYRGQGEPALSADGRYVAFRSDTTANDVVPSWGSGPVAGEHASTQVFVWDRQATSPDGAVRLVSAGGSVPNGSAAEPSLSADGRIVAFSSTSTNLLDGVLMPQCGPLCPTQVYALDRDADADGMLDEDPAPVGLRLISADASTQASLTGGAVAGAGSSEQPEVSGDGNMVVFVTQAANLLPLRAAGGGAIGQGEVIAMELASGRLRRLSVSADGYTPTAALNAHPAVSHAGRVVAFDTASPQLLEPGETARHIATVTTPPTLSLGALDVGTVAPGFASQEWFISVVNEGPTSFSPTSAVTSNPEFTVTGGTCATGGTVPPAGSCTVTVTFTPSQPGERNGTLTVAETGFEALTVTAELRGSGGEPALKAFPDGVNLGGAVVGTPTRTAAVDIRNVGPVPATIGSVEVAGAHALDFSAGRGCRQRTLAPGASCSIEIGFTPSGGGQRSATLTVATTRGQYTAVVLAGEGRYEPVLTTSEQVVPAGSFLSVTGSGFPPDAPVVVTWADGVGSSSSSTVAPDGTFALQFTVPRGERPGERIVVATTSGELSATAALRVVREAQHGPASASWPGR